MKPTDVGESGLVPADGEVGDALAIAVPLTVPQTVEELVTNALTHGLEADFDAWRQDTPDVDDGNANGWANARTLSGAFVVELCTSTMNGTHTFPRGIRIRGARIQGDIDLNTGSIDALLALERCRIEGSIMLRDCTTRLVNLAGSQLCGDISADRLRSSAGVYLRDKFVCTGSVRLSAAVIDGDLDCNDGTILGEGKEKDGSGTYALRCDRMKVTGGVFLRRFVAAKSAVRLLDAKVGANVMCEGASLTSPGRTALLADNMKVEGSLVLRDWKHPPNGALSFRNATASVLLLGAPKSVWPNPRTVSAQGFRYTSLETKALVSRELCEQWLETLVRDPFSPQPYEKCAQALREIGLADDAKEIGILRRRVQRSLPGVPRWRYLKDGLLDLLIGYGYRPGRSVLALAYFALLGAAVFSAAKSDGAMVPSDSAILASDAYKANHEALPPGYPSYEPFVYSLDVLLPIIDFQQDSKWRPNPRATVARRIAGTTYLFEVGRVAVVYQWLQIALGWLLSSLLVASLGGLVRKE